MGACASPSSAYKHIYSLEIHSKKSLVITQIFQLKKIEWVNFFICVVKAFSHNIPFFIIVLRHEKSTDTLAL